MTGTGSATVDHAVLWAAALAALAAGSAVVWRALRGIGRLVSAVDELLDDWRGTPARPGVAARPGVVERVARIEHELHPNSGLSLRDAVNRIEDSVRELQDQAVGR